MEVKDGNSGKGSGVGVVVVVGEGLEGQQAKGLFIQGGSRDS